MKKSFLFLFAVMLSLCSHAQVLKGDMDDDGKLTMNDVTLLIDKYLNPTNNTPGGNNTGGSGVTVGDLTLTSGDATSVSPTSVNLSGHIDGLEKLKVGTYSCGYVYGTEPEPTPANGVYKAVTPDNGDLSINLTGMSNDTQYYFRIVLVTSKNEVFYGETGEFYMSDVITPGSIIDLGLSVKWAACDLGSNAPQVKGKLYAWGETETKSSYSQSNYTHYNSAFGVYFDLGSLISGNPDYDAAYAALGSDWHMPSVDEANELITKCTWESITYRSVKGNRVTGPNGNSIFIPSGYYWTASKSSNSYSATIMKENSTNTYSRYSGLPIRPVKGYSVSTGSDYYSAKLNVGSLPTGSKVGFYVGSAETPNASNSKFVESKLNEDGTFTLEYTESTAYYFRPVIIHANGEMFYFETRSKGMDCKLIPQECYVDRSVNYAGAPMAYASNYVSDRFLTHEFSYYPHVLKPAVDAFDEIIPGEFEILDKSMDSSELQYTICMPANSTASPKYSFKIPFVLSGATYEIKLVTVPYWIANNNGIGVYDEAAYRFYVYLWERQNGTESGSATIGEYPSSGIRLVAADEHADGNYIVTRNLKADGTIVYTDTISLGEYTFKDSYYDQNKESVILQIAPQVTSTQMKNNIYTKNVAIAAIILKRKFEENEVMP